jgi:NitT/TauT family transport system substrate-binding protein
VSDTRIVAEADKVFGGPMPAGCLYTQQTFLDKNPQTAQALANALVRADKWIQGAGRATSSRRCPKTTCWATARCMSMPSWPPRARSRPTA